MTASETARTEQDWISASGDRAACRWLIRYAQAINSLDIVPLQNHLAPDVTYESQSVFDRMTGANVVLSYWREKFQTIRRSKDGLVAELACFPHGQPCVRLFQAASAFDTNWLDEPVAAMTVTTDQSGNAKSCLMITCVPHPGTACGTGIFPGLSQPPALRPRRFVRRTHRFDEITLYVFYLDGEFALDRDMAKSIAFVRREIEGVRIVELKETERNAAPEWEAFTLLRLSGFPSVGALYEGSSIYRHSGWIDGPELVAALRRAAPLFVAA